MKKSNARWIVTGVKFPQYDSEKIDQLLSEKPLNRDAVIHAMGKVAISIASRYVCDYQNPQDLVSEALLGLVKSVHYLISNEHVNPRGYIIKSIHGQICNFLRFEKARSVAKSVDLYDYPNSFPLEYFRCLEEIDYVINNDPDEEKRNLKRSIINLRIEGYTDVEISNILKVPRWKINMLRTSIERSFNINRKDK